MDADKTECPGCWHSKVNHKKDHGCIVMHSVMVNGNYEMIPCECKANWALTNS